MKLYNLGKPECNIELTFFKIDLPYIPIFIADDNFEKRLISKNPICPTHRVRGHPKDGFIDFLY